MNEKFIFVPLENVGPFKFGSNITDYLDASIFEKYDEEDKEVNWRVFADRDDNFRIYTENDLIISILCDRFLYYRNVNLINLTFKDLKKIINANYNERSTIETEIGIQDVFEFEKLGMQVWLYDGVVETIICTPKLDD